MKFDLRKIVVTILSLIVAVLGGSQYQQMSNLYEMQDNVKKLTQTVDSIAHRDFARFESE